MSAAVSEESGVGEERWGGKKGGEKVEVGSWEEGRKGEVERSFTVRSSP